MATIRWRGDAPATAQIQSWAFGGTWESGDLIRVTIGGKTKDFTAGSTTTATVVANLVAAWNALSAATWPEFAELTASQATTTFKLTADTAGKPFIVTLLPLESDAGAADAQTIEGGTSATTGTSATASSGPSDWSTAANWSGGAVPVDGDEVCIEDSDVDILYGLNQSSIQPASLAIAQSYSGRIGLPAINADSASGSYYEYRERYLRIGAPAIVVGRGEGSGSQRINLNTGTDQTSLQMFQTGPAESGREKTVQWIGTHADNVVHIVRGSLGIALEAGQAATVATLRVGYVDNVSGDSQIRIGEDVTLGAVIQAGGAVVVGCAATTITQDDGSLTLEGSGAIGTLTIRGGRCFYNTVGALTTGTISGAGELDFSQDLRAKTVTNPLERYGALAKVKDPYKVVSSLAIDNNETADLAGLEIGSHVRVTRGTVS